MSILPKQMVLNENQYDRLSNIFDNAGQVTLGVVVISPLVSGFKNQSLLLAVLGLLVVIFCWLVSIWLSKRSD